MAGSSSEAEGANQATGSTRNDLGNVRDRSRSEEGHVSRSRSRSSMGEKSDESFDMSRLDKYETK